MGKIEWKPGNMLYPLPAVLVSVCGREGKHNIFTAAWAGTVCTNPPMVSVSVRPERYSYHMIRETGEFVINLATVSTTVSPGAAPVEGSTPMTVPTFLSDG